MTCDNAAFADNGLEIEASMILHRTAEKIENQQSSGILVDSNGNNVGSFHFEEEN